MEQTTIQIVPESEIHSAISETDQIIEITDVGIIGLDSLCRLCSNRSDNLISIYEGEGLEYQLQYKMNQYLPFQVEQVDSMPNHCCYQCASTLLSWHELYETSMEADRRLKALQQDLQRISIYEEQEAQTVVEEPTENCITITTSPDQRSPAVSPRTQSPEAQKLEPAAIFDSPPSSPSRPEVEHLKIITEPIVKEGNTIDTRGNVQIIKIETPVKTEKPKTFQASIYLCQKCKTSFATNSDFIEHLKTHEKIVLMDKKPEVIEHMDDENSGVEDKVSNSDEELTTHNDDDKTLDDSLSKEVKNICPICLVTFEKKSEFIRHNFEHPLILKCKKCRRKFSNEKFLEIHMEDSHHSKPRIDCKYCSDKFPSKTCLNTHLKNKHLVCSVCFIKCESIVALKSHRRELHPNIFNTTGKKTYPCSKCDKVFRSRQGLVRHGDRLHGVNAETDPYKCSLCSISFTSETALKYHILHHDTAQDLACEVCLRKFNRVSNLNAHLNTHVKDIFCKVCCSSFISQFRLENHLSTHSDIEIIKCERFPNTIECPFQNCNEMFSSRLQMYNHKKTHLDIVDYPCSDCDRKFKTTSQLTTHRKIHHECDTYCYTCGKQFSTVKILREHVRLHTGEKPFSCDICKLQFRCQSSMVAHRVIHSSERRYMCGICKRTFARAAYLKEHLRTHRKDRPFICKLCDQSFTQSSALKNHMSFKHQTCTICKIVIGNTVKLRNHLSKEHNIKIKTSKKSKTENCESMSD